MYSFEYHASSFVVFTLTSLYSYLYSLKYVYEVKQPSRFCLVPKVTQSRASSPLRPDTQKASEQRARLILPAERALVKAWPNLSRDAAASAYSL